MVTINREHTIPTADGKHNLYVREWGNAQGTPILYLHGGPGGGGCDDHVTRLCNESKHRVILLDQRGSGRSTPFASTEANTTQLLVEDIELVRQTLAIESLVIFGRSWGATLALCYAIEYPRRVDHIVTGGVFLGTAKEDAWINGGEYKLFYPEIWDEYKDEDDSILKAAQLAFPTLKLDDRSDPIDETVFDEQFLALERYYADNAWFIEDGYILKNASKITMPVTIIQGRYDMMTPPLSAYKLHTSLPNSTLQWTIAGHSKSDRANFDATKATLNQL